MNFNDFILFHICFILYHRLSFIAKYRNGISIYESIKSLCQTNQNLRRVICLKKKNKDKYKTLKNN